MNACTITTGEQVSSSVSHTRLPVRSTMIRTVIIHSIDSVTAVTAKYTTGGAICKPTNRTTTPTMPEIQYMTHPKSVDRTGLLGASATGTL